MKRITGLDGPLLGAAACLLALTAFGAIWINAFDDPNAGVIPLLQALPYALAVWLVSRVQREDGNGRRAVVAVIVVALAMRLMLLPGWPVSTDIYRYIWDGRV